MALYRSIGAALEDDNSGTNPIDVRKDLGGLFIRAGILPGPANALVAGTAGWAYALWSGSWVTQTATGDGYHLWGNDGGVTVGTSGVGGTVPAAPGSGLSRIDILWVRHPSNDENGETTSAPVAGVTCGTPQSSPTAPAIPAGAFELARNTMTSAATTTASTGNTITQTAPYTAPRGGVVPCRTIAERDALTASATAANPIYANVAGVLWTCNNVTTWRAIAEVPVNAAPFAQAAGLTADIAAGINTINLPAGRFTQPPIVTVTIASGSGGAAGATARVTSITTTQFTLMPSVGPYAWLWQAIQMTSASAAG